MPASNLPLYISVTVYRPLINNTLNVIVNDVLFSVTFNHIKPATQYQYITGPIRWPTNNWMNISVTYTGPMIQFVNIYYDSFIGY